MWLPWEFGLGLALAFGFTARATRDTSERIHAVAIEGVILSALYALWQLAGSLSLLGIDDALTRGAQIWEFERAIFLPNELTLQQWMLPSSFWTQFANLYYAIAHVAAMGVFIVWMFFRHRDQYSKWRNALAIVTGLSLIIQLIPVAPPRLTEETGMIDTGIAYGQSVYGVLGRGIAGQLQALPSIHVAWAALIGWAVWEASNSRWRVLGPIHFAITFFVVALTGNHYWVDGLLAMVLLVGARYVGARIASVSAPRPAVTQPVPEVVGAR